MNSATAVSVLLKQAGSAIAETLHRGLCDAGAPVVLVPTAYDVVAEAQRAAGAVGHILLGVDCFGPGEFRLIPLVRREWPDTVVVAYHAPGFEHKGRIAELVGADIVLSTAEDASRFLAHLPSPRVAEPVAAPPAPPSEAPAPAPAAPAGPAADAAPPPVAPPAPAAEREPGRAPVPRIQPRRPPPPAPAPTPAPEAGPAPAVPPADATPEPMGEPPPAHAATRPTTPAIESYLAGAARPESNSQPHQPRPAAALPADEVENLDGDQELKEGKVLGTIELTNEELRVLLGEEDDA